MYISCSPWGGGEGEVQGCIGAGGTPLTSASASPTGGGAGGLGGGFFPIFGDFPALLGVTRRGRMETCVERILAMMLLAVCASCCRLFSPSGDRCSR